MTPSFRILDAAIPSERDEWIEQWLTWPSREIQSHPEYVALFTSTGDRALAVFYEAGGGTKLLYPFILRQIMREGQATDFTDITTPYGYGGPAYWGGALDQPVVEDFWMRFENWSTDHAVVSEFIRFGLFPNSTVPYPGEQIERQANIVVSLDQTEDELWRSFEPKVRKNVKRALRDNVEISIQESSDGFDAFHRIYTSTMERRSADDGFYFPLEFFNRIHAGLSGHFAYFHASYLDEIVSTELVLVSADAVYSFLGGTNPEAFSARPNDLLKFEIMKWAQLAGKSHFVLGGGLTSGDGIERYKRAFAPTSTIDFYTGQRILNSSAYQSLLAARKGDMSISDNFFPGYRA